MYVDRTCVGKMAQRATETVKTGKSQRLVAVVPGTMQCRTYPALLEAQLPSSRSLVTQRGFDTHHKTRRIQLSVGKGVLVFVSLDRMA
jgi:hypothetical protein